VASMFEWPMPRERDEAVCYEAARLIDALLVCVARGQGALDVAIGEGLHALGAGDRVLRLGYAGIGDYAREKLGIAASTAQKMVRLARALRERPLLRAAVRSGEVSVRQAEAVLPVAHGDAEESWVARARIETVRALQAAVKDPSAAQAEEDEQWDRVCIAVSPEARPVVDEAMELAGKILTPTAPKWQRVEVVSQEFLGANEAPGEGAVAELAAPADDWTDPLKEWLEKETRQWAFLSKVDPVAAPEPTLDAETDPQRIDEELQRRSKMRDRWDEVFGHLAMLFRRIDGWRFVGFASFGHYCDERLGMAQRTVEQRASLERRLYELPSLREAMRQGRLSYEKARLIARYADEASLENWIKRAESTTCVALRRELQAKEEAQMCARGEFALFVPRRVRGLLGLAFRAACKAAGRPLSPGECLHRIAAHFVETWKPALAEKSTVQKKVLERDGGFCRVPACSRAAAHVHHIVYRSAGGSDDPANLVSLCAAHHLHGVHKGSIRVWGEAPDRLHWELGR
jgi:HNH endonuclease